MSEPKLYPYFLFTICFLGVALGAMNSVLAPSYLPDILREFKSSSITSENAGAWINFAFLAGGTIGGISFAFISDQIGRRNTLAYALLFCGIGSGLGAISPSWLLLT